MKYLVGLLLTLVCAAALADPMATVMLGGQRRAFVIHMPPATAHPLPLVLAFHGAGMTPQLFEKVSGLDAQADRRDFIVVYPQGLQRRWNAALAGDRPDDVAFTAAILRYMRDNVRVSRVYAVGFSNGAMFANALACSGKIKLAAIAAVAGFIPQLASTACAAAPPMTVLEIAADRDPIMPFAGGLVNVLSPPDNIVLSYAATLQGWARVDHCLGLDTSFHESQPLARIAPTSCGAGVTVLGLVLKSQLHSWSGRGQPYPIDTARVVTDFLLAH